MYLYVHICVCVHALITTQVKLPNNFLLDSANVQKVKRSYTKHTESVVLTF